MLKVCNLGYEVIENGKKVTIVKDISFTVEDGEMLVITGPNGGGKSTVAKLLMGILPATEGQILLDGEDIMDLSVNERANAGIGYAFQQPPAFKGMTVRRLLNLAAGKELPEHICCDLLSSVGMCAGEYLDRKWTPHCREGNGNGWKLPLFWQKAIKCVFLTNRRLA